MSPQEKIKHLIEESSLSYSDLEKMTGISKSALQRYASGATKKLPIDVVEKLATALGTTAAHIMGWNKENIATKNDSEFSDVKKDFIKYIDTLTDEQIIRVKELVDTALRLGEK